MNLDTVISVFFAAFVVATLFGALGALFGKRPR